MYCTVYTVQFRKRVHKLSSLLIGGQDLITRLKFSGGVLCAKLLYNRVGQFFRI